MTLRLVRLLAPALASLTLLLASPVAADCNGPYPSFTAVAPTANRIVYGTVVRVEPIDAGWSTRFRLRGWSILGGLRPTEVWVRGVLSQPCSGPLLARVSDRIAIAFDGVAFDTKVPANAIAWIGGQPPDMVGIELLTVAEVFAAAGVAAPEVIPTPPPTTTAPSADPSLAGSVSWLWSISLSVVGIGALGMALRRRQT